ncbi:hypothetical protein Agub_g6309, partial [Astrephomene gubernaculifera]
MDTAQAARPKYKYAGSLHEGHKEAIFCVAFNTCDLAHRDVFATVGHCRVSIYRLLPAGQFQVLQVYEDEDGSPGSQSRPKRKAPPALHDPSTPSAADPTSAPTATAALANTADAATSAVDPNAPATAANPATDAYTAPRGTSGGTGSSSSGGERFHCCKWSRDPDSGAALLLAAGRKALVRVLDVSRGQLVHTFSGHGQDINDIAVHPQRPHLFLTGSDDCSVRLWNYRSRTCVAVFAGEGGHKNKVLTLDFHPW